MNLGDGLLRQQADFDGADKFLLVGRSNLSCGFGIQARKHLMQVRRAVLKRGCSEAIAKLFGAQRQLGQAFEQSAQIKPGADGEKRKARSFKQIIKSSKRSFAVTASG